MSSDLNIRSLTIDTHGIYFMKKGVEALHKVDGNQTLNHWCKTHSVRHEYSTWFWIAQSLGCSRGSSNVRFSSVYSLHHSLAN